MEVADPQDIHRRVVSSDLFWLAYQTDTQYAVRYADGFLPFVPRNPHYLLLLLLGYATAIVGVGIAFAVSKAE